jgi:hypothetical protein
VLKNYFITFKFHRFCQSGFYFDFFYKKLSEVFVRNVFVYAAQFFGEKYMIEVLTKKIVDAAIFNTNKIIGWNKLQYSWFFIQFLSVIFYTLALINLIILFV